MKLKKAEIRDILAATFPDYRGRTFSIEFQEQFAFYNTNWGGGSKNEYAFVRADGKSAQLTVPAPWGNTIEGQRVDIPADVLIVEHCTYCGHDLGIRIYANPCHLPKWLSAGSSYRK